MTPRMSMIGASIRKLFASIGKFGDYYWDQVVLAMTMNAKSDTVWNKTVLAMHMDTPDPYWSSTVLAMHMDADPYWSNVVLAMHMNGANGGTVFTDMKGKVTTPTGAPTTSTSQFKFGTASAYFNGAGDSLSLPYSTDWNFGSGDFTVDLWFYMSVIPAAGKYPGLIGSRGTNSTIAWSIFLNGDDKRAYLGISENGSTLRYAIAPGLTNYLNKWVHLACVRQGTKVSIFLNGIKGTDATLAANASLYVYNGVVSIARIETGNTFHDFNGYIDDIRVTKGIARYTDNFVPPSKAFIDNSWVDEKAHVITANGNAVLSNTQSKFGGYSAYFDGVLDYLSIPHATDLNLATGDFTIEAWVYVTNMTYTQCLVEKDQTYGATFPSYAILIGSTGGFSLIVGTGAGATYNQSLNSIAGVIPLNTWTHIAAIRQGTNLQLFANGNICASGIQTGTPTDGGKPLIVGYFPAGGTVAVDNYFNGYIDDLRITKGVARYTSPFIPQNRPFQEPTNTPVFLDEKGKSVLPFGSASISATQSKFGGYSASFNGTTDYLSIPASNDFGFANSDFTIEMWLYGGALTGALIDTRQIASQFGYFAISNGRLGVWNGSVLMEGNATISNASWIHVAIVRYKSNLSVYVNGLLDSVTYMPVDFGIIRPCFIGATYAGANFLNGYIDDLRITKGVARYIDEFSAPKVPFQELNNHSGFLEETGKSLTTFGNASLSANAKYGDSSAYFDGTVILNPLTSSDFTFGTADFTIEMWINISALPVTGKGYGLVSMASALNLPSTFFIADNGKLTAWNNGSISTLGSVIPLSVWNHACFVRASGVLYCFLNGVVQFAVAHTSNYAEAVCKIGANPDSSNPMQGYIDDLRITKGVARYIGAFTPPVRTISNYKKQNYDPYIHSVVLGMHMEGADTGSIFTDIKGHTFTTTGSPQTKTAIKKFGASSIYLNGSSLISSAISPSDFVFGAGDYTIECWIYPTSGNLYQDIIFFGTDYTDAWFLRYYGNFHTFGHSLYSGTTAQDCVSPVQENAPLNAWTHVAISKNGTTVRMFVNGNLVQTKTFVLSQNIPTGTPLLRIGRDNTTNWFQGYIDDLRITKGVGRYTENFEPIEFEFPDTWHSNICEIADPYYENVVLGMHMDGTSGASVFTDVKGKTVTPVGNTVTSSAQSKFGATSAYFDGTGDYLSIPSSTDFDFGTGDFTIEFWVYMPTYAEQINGYPRLFERGTYNSAGALSIVVFKTNGILVFTYGTPNKDMVMGRLLEGAWTHVAISRIDSKLSCFLGGLLTVSSTVTENFTNAGVFKIGIDSTMDAAFRGYIDDFRITKGVGRYSANFIPSGPFKTYLPDPDPFIANVVLGLHMDGNNSGTSFPDIKGKTVTTNGNVQTLVSTKKFGTASAYFDGTGDNLQLPTSTDWNFGTGDFTIECWIYTTNVNSRQAIFAGGNAEFTFFISGYSLVVGTLFSADFLTCPGSIDLNTWKHVVVQRSGTVLSIYSDGVLKGSITNSTNISYSSAPKIGSTSYSSSYDYFSGFIDDLRVTKGAARYSGDFTPPAKAFPNL